MLALESQQRGYNKGIGASVIKNLGFPEMPVELQPENDQECRPMGGDNVGRDKVIGDIVHGDKVGRDKISITITEEQAYNVSGLPNPYLGLKSYEYRDRFAYAGRDVEIRDAVIRLTAPGEQQVLLFVTGASGSGKSSFAQAGLIPALESHYQERHKGVRRAVMRPGTHPLAALTDALEQLGLHKPSPVSLDAPDKLFLWLCKHTPENQINLLVIDQFEETFTQSQSDQRRGLFDFLAKLPAFNELHTHIIVTLRSDYLGELFEHRALWEIAKGGEELRAMTKVELKEAILGPMIAVSHEDERYRQKRFEPALLERLAMDAAKNTAFLPLMQVCLVELWNGGLLKLERYGGLAVAIQERAETVYTHRDYDVPRPKVERSEEEQEAILGIFLDLVSVSLYEYAVRDIRRRRYKRDLMIDPQRDRLLDDLAAARLLSVSLEDNDEMVEIIHDALITNWERLRDAINEYRERLKHRAQFEMALDEWLANGQKDDYLLVGIRLAEAKALMSMGDIAMSGTEAIEFFRSSKALEAREARSRWLRWVAMVGAILVAIVLALFGSGLLKGFLYPPLLTDADWVTIPPGEFLMGSSNDELALAQEMCQECDYSDELPQHPVYLDAYQMMSFEVTNRHYLQCLNAGACNKPNNAIYTLTEYADHPVTDVSWYQAQAFCEWVGGRLPTEVEWEKAARGGLKEMPFPWGPAEPLCWVGDPVGARFDDNDLCDNAGTAPVKSYYYNNYGLYDMAGNVLEWVADWYDAYPGANPEENWAFGQRFRVMRGGSWYNSSSNLRVTRRLNIEPADSSAYSGFRCARSP